MNQSFTRHQNAVIRSLEREKSKHLTEVSRLTELIKQAGRALKLYGSEEEAPKKRRTPRKKQVKESKQEELPFTLTPVDENGRISLHSVAEATGMSTRTQNMLIRQGVAYLDEVPDREYLQKIPGIWKQTLDEIDAIKQFYQSPDPGADVGKEAQ